MMDMVILAQAQCRNLEIEEPVRKAEISCNVLAQRLNTHGALQHKGVCVCARAYVCWICASLCVQNLDHILCLHI